jgi:hypothetical protein
MKQFDHGRILHWRWNILVEFMYFVNKNLRGKLDKNYSSTRDPPTHNSVGCSSVTRTLKRQSFLCYQLSITPWRRVTDLRYSSIILGLCSRWRSVASFISRPLHPRGKNPRYLLDRRLGGPQCLSGYYGEEKNLSPLPEIEPWLG